jgi:hypothetical protein
MLCRHPLLAGSLNQLATDLGIPFDSLNSANTLQRFPLLIPLILIHSSIRISREVL